MNIDRKIVKMSNLQLTLSILKPHIVKNPLAANAIQQIIIENQLKIVQRKKIKMTKQMAAQFYEEHKGKFFYNRLQTFMCRLAVKLRKIEQKNKKNEQTIGFNFSGPIEVLVLAGDNAITRWRSLLGPTKVYQTIYTHPESIRGLFGLSDTRNVCHGSDSMDSAKREINIFFEEFNVDRWLSDNKTL